MTATQRIAAINRLVEAALDQPKPTPELKDALNVVLRDRAHPLRTIE